MHQPVHAGKKEKLFILSALLVLILLEWLKKDAAPYEINLTNY